MRNAWRSASSNGKISGSGFTVSTFRSCSHWPAKFDTSASARRSSSIRRTWRSSTAGSFSRPCSAASSSSASGIVLHRKNESRDASSTSLIRCAAAGPGAGRVALDAEQELRRHEHRLDGGLDAARRNPPLAAALLVERVERLDVGARHGTPERAVRERGENRARAGRLLRRPLGAADENRRAARGLAAPGRLVRTADDQPADVRPRRRHVEPLHARAAQSQIDRPRDPDRPAASVAVVARRVPLGFQVLARRRHADRVQPGFHGDPDLERIGLRTVSGLQARDPDLEHILGVERKVVRDRHAGARVERHVLVQLLVPRALVRIAFRVVNLFDRLQRQIADRQAADPARRRHVPIQQRRRGREHRRDVVEPVAGIVDRQPLARPDVDREQIADGVAVLGAIQPVHRRAPRIRVGHRRAIDRLFQIGRELARDAGIRPRADGRRRHLTRSQFPRNFFPDVRVFRNARQFEGLQGKPARLEPVVVAGDAVGADQAGVVRRGRRGRRRRSGLLRSSPDERGRTEVSLGRAPGARTEKSRRDQPHQRSAHS